jgi:hypothetical protein
MPKLREVIREPKQRYIVRELYVGMRPCSATGRQIGSKCGNQKNPRKYSAKKCISYQFRADVQTYGHRPRYTADNDVAETDVCA